MTAKFLHSFPARNAFRLVSQNKKFFIVTCILQLLGIPLIMGSGMLEVYYSERRELTHDYSSYNFNYEAYMAIGCFCFGIAVLLGIFFGINAYREEWDKSKVDMLYSLPLTGKQRFFSDYLGGLGMYVIPYIGAVLLGWIVLFIMTPIVRSVMDSHEIGQLNTIYKYYLLITIGLFFLMCLYYTISSFVASCCGTLFENIYTNILLNLLIPGTFAAILAVITEIIDTMDFEYSWEFIGYTSPIGGLIYLIYLVFEKTSDVYYSYGSTYTASAGELGDLGLVPAYLRWILIIVVLTVAILILAWRLYEHRKAEHVGKPFVYIGIYYVILTAITVCILCILESGIEALIPVLIFSAIVYFIMEVIRKRGFKKFWFSAICYIITVVVALASMFSISATNAFGRAYYIPALASVTSIKLEFEGNYYDDIGYQLNFKDKEIISKIQDFQKECNQNRKNHYSTQLENAIDGYYELNYNNYNNSYEYYDEYYGEYYGEYYEQVESAEYYDNNYNNTYTYKIDPKYIPHISSCATLGITYYTITGSAIYRTYELYADEYINLMDMCIGTEVYAEANYNLLKSRLENTYKQYDNNMSKTYYPSKINFAAAPPNTNDYYRSYESEQYMQIQLSDVESNLNLLTECYLQDLKNMTSEDFRTSEIICNIVGLPVRACNQETYALLQKWGFEEFSLYQKYYSILGTDTQKLDIRIYAPETYQTSSLQYPSNTLQAIFVKPDATNIPSYQNTIYSIIDLDTSLQDLMQIARKYYISSEPCYVLVINNSKYMIPSEYSELAEQVINNKQTNHTASPANQSNIMGIF
ncbi:MAG: hypothetical protein K2G88_03415 [Oscillospiraceae bacterium]|nr:hypothetical protein [Oscillospiraceae bacterium]